MSKALQAITLLFEQSISVTCDGCGRELKTPIRLNLARLLRVGCPTCHGHRFTYHGLPEAQGQQMLVQIRGATQV